VACGPCKRALTARARGRSLAHPCLLPHRYSTVAQLRPCALLLAVQGSDERPLEALAADRRFRRAAVRSGWPPHFQSGCNCRRPVIIGSRVSARTRQEGCRAAPRARGASRRCAAVGALSIAGRASRGCALNQCA
jgi:hypothetical protein